MSSRISDQDVALGMSTDEFRAWALRNGVKPKTLDGEARERARKARSKVLAQIADFDRQERMHAELGRRR